MLYPYQITILQCIILLICKYNTIPIKIYIKNIIANSVEIIYEPFMYIHIRKYTSSIYNHIEKIKLNILSSFFPPFEINCHTYIYILISNHILSNMNENLHLSPDQYRKCHSYISTYKVDTKNVTTL